MWPTPKAKDYKGSVTGETLQKRRKMTRGVDLSEQVARETLPTPTCPGPHQVGTIGEWGGCGNPVRTPETMTLAGGSLNPQFVEWLMGFPMDWTSIPGYKSGKASRASRKGSKTESIDSVRSETP